MQIKIDTSNPTGKLVAGLLSVVSEFEADTKKQRRIDGIVAARARGVKFGRKPKMDDTNVLQALSLKEAGYTNKEIAMEFKVGKSTLLRYLSEFRKT